MERIPDWSLFIVKYKVNMLEQWYKKLLFAIMEMRSMIFALTILGRIVDLKTIMSILSLIIYNWSTLYWRSVAVVGHCLHKDCHYEINWHARRNNKVILSTIMCKVIHNSVSKPGKEKNAVSFSFDKMSV